MLTNELSPNVLLKLEVLWRKLGAQDLASALDKSLDIANFIAGTVNSSATKLLVEEDGKFTHLKAIA